LKKEEEYYRRVLYVKTEDEWITRDLGPPL